MELFTVRPMEESDLEVVMYLENTCFIAPWGLKEISYELNDNPVSSLWVIESSQSGVVGFIDYWITFDSATIAQIAIRKQYQGRHLANILMQEMIDDCYAKKVLNITLEVRTSNVKAISLYKKFDFKEIVIKPHYYDNGEDALYMVRKENY